MSELLVTVTIAGRRCGFHAKDVQSVIELEEITPVPGVADFVIGLTALRSRALTVIDCRKSLGIKSDGELQSDTRAPVVQYAEHSYALLVDKVEDVTEAVSEIDTVLGGFGGEWSAMAEGIVETADGPVLMLDIGALIAGPIEPAAAA